MIPANFEYRRPASKAEALRMLADGGEEARPLGGGHSLIPLMKLRMAQPSALIDVGRLAELKTLDLGATITLGSSVTQHELIGHEGLAAVCPILRETALQIADPQVRYCGTLGGNIGNGDPGNDMPAVMMCLDADYVVERAGGSRTIKAREFYLGPYVTALEPGEMITAVRFQAPAAGHGAAYAKLKRKVGDYATAAAAVILDMDGGKVRTASIALTNVAPTPLYAADAAAAVTGTGLEAEAIDAAAAAARAIADPGSDRRGSVDYRRSMVGVMVRRALERAAGPNAAGRDGGMFGWRNH